MYCNGLPSRENNHQPPLPWQAVAKKNDTAYLKLLATLAIFYGLLCTVLYHHVTTSHLAFGRYHVLHSHYHRIHQPINF